MTQIKAIETRYAGYKFRSRLEARWAVFFDALGLKWEYEPEGFDLGDGIYYLPDFYLPEYNTWVEVKGGISSGRELDEQDKLKVSLFSHLSDCDQVLVLGDLPKQGSEILICSVRKEKYKHFPDKHILVCCMGFFGMYSLFEPAPTSLWRFIPESIVPTESRIGMASTENIKSEISNLKIKNSHITCHHGVGVVMDAYEKARSARFEHGEVAQ